MMRKKISDYMGRLLLEKRQFSQVKVPCLTIVTIIQDRSLEAKVLKIINTLCEFCSLTSKYWIISIYKSSSLNFYIIKDNASGARFRMCIIKYLFLTLPDLKFEFLVMDNPKQPLASNHPKNSDPHWQVVSNTSAIQTAFIINIISTATTTNTKITVTSNFSNST